MDVMSYQPYKTLSTHRLETDTFGQSFAWMFIGLLASGLASFAVVSIPRLANLVFTSKVVFIVLATAELALVFFLSARITHMSYTVAASTYLLYAILNGVTLSAILAVYQDSSLATAFFTAACLFGVMAVYGATTRHDLTNIGSLALMGLLGAILASLINVFLKSDAYGYILSYITVAVFIALTAYDAQKLKRLALLGVPNIGIYGALMLYLDLINIFLNLLNIFGKRRQR